MLISRTGLGVDTAVLQITRSLSGVLRRNLSATPVRLLSHPERALRSSLGRSHGTDLSDSSSLRDATAGEAHAWADSLTGTTVHP